MATMLISEFAQRAGVSISTLRYWHTEDLLVPVDVRAGSGYRRYSSQQLHQARLIHWLRQAGVGLPQIRQILGTVHQAELQDLLGALAQRFREQADTHKAAAQTLDRIRVDLMSRPTGVLESGWMASLSLLPIGRLSVAFVGIRGGIGRTPAAISTASMLHAAGRNVAVVEVSPRGQGALKWAHMAGEIGDPLPYPVVSIREFHALPTHVDVIFDSSSRHEDFLMVAMLADKVVKCSQLGEWLDHSLSHELPMFATAGVNVYGPDFGVMVTGMPVEETVLNMESDLNDLPGWQQEEWNVAKRLLTRQLANLGRRGLPVLGVIPEREVHRLAVWTSPREFRDHHHVLGRFLGIQHCVLPEPPADYLDQLRRHQDALFNQLMASRRQ